MIAAGVAGRDVRRRETSERIRQMEKEREALWIYSKLKLHL